MPVTECLLCASTQLERVIDLGMHPLADTFLKEEQLSVPESRYPLQVLLCMFCGHTMASVIVPPEERYQTNEYSYDSSNSRASIEHFNDMARTIAAQRSLGPADLVVDVGGNVGTLLSAFREHAGTQILNIEPSSNIAEIARQNGVETLQRFLDDEAAEIVATRGGAAVITMTNVFNHLGAFNESMQAAMRALSPDGALVIETPYQLHLVQKLAFDTIYLEHVSYFALKPLQKYFAQIGLTITDVEENEYMGGSIRLTVERQGLESPQVASCIAREEQAGLYDPAMYAQFMSRVEEFKSTLMAELRAAKQAGGRIVGIGAATKGNTLLNYCGIDATLLEFVTDASPLKVGKYTPGSRIPIVSDDAITDSITHGLILPWNIASFLTEKLAPRYPHLAFIVPHMT